MKIDDLNIEVTPLVEDAFYAFRDIDDKELEAKLNALPDMYGAGDVETDALMDKFLQDVKASDNALARFRQCKDTEAKKNALATALQMIENQKEYGYPCVAWMPD